MQLGPIFLLCAATLQSTWSSFSEKDPSNFETGYVALATTTATHSPTTTRSTLCNQKVLIIDDYAAEWQSESEAPVDAGRGRGSGAVRPVSLAGSRFDVDAERLNVQNYKMSLYEDQRYSLHLTSTIGLEISRLRNKISAAKKIASFGKTDNPDDDDDDGDDDTIQDCFVHCNYDEYGEYCMNWYEKSRRRMHWHSAECMSRSHPEYLEHNRLLADGQFFWFELLPACRYKHRILVMQAIGVQFVVAERFAVVPVLLKNGKMVGLWRDLKDELDGQWRPVLGIRMSLPFPLDNNSIALAAEANLMAHPDCPLVQKLFEVHPGDLWLERAALELASTPGGRFPVTVHVPNFQVCMHLVGWRMDESALTSDILHSLAMKIDGSITEFFDVFLMDRDNHASVDCLLPQRRMRMTGTYAQGLYIDSFPGMFDRAWAVNHLLLLPAKPKDWTQKGGIGNERLFGLLFGPLIGWLEDPLSDPTDPDHQQHVVARHYVMAKDDLTVRSKCRSRPDILINYDPLVDLYDMEQSVHAFRSAFMSGQESACAAGEILFSLLLRRCCVLLGRPASEWIAAAHASQAQKNLLKVQSQFLNHVNTLLRESDPGGKHYSELMGGDMECYQVYVRLASCL